jgi:DNA-directed RNA polymerase specialized sigma24 family protein
MLNREAMQSAADLHWLATLLSGSPETAIDVTTQAIELADDPDQFFATWMQAWSRRLVIAGALTAVREQLARSARRIAWNRGGRQALPPRSWKLDSQTTKADLERALLSMDLFPRAVVLLLVFERVPLKDAAVLLDADVDLVLKAQAAGVRELTIHLASMQRRESVAVQREERSSPELLEVSG